MHLRHFFRGLLKREEVASAFLATLLEDDPQFRLGFFQALFLDDAVVLADGNWKVEVEVDRVDVRLESDKAVVLIENKVRAGAYKSGQLVRYYESELDQVPADKPIFVAFVAPQGVGARETDNLAATDVFRDNDIAASVTWQALASMSNSLQQPEFRRWFVESGFQEIARIIEKGSRPTYPREGTRAVLAEIADDAFRTLQSLSQVQLSQWREHDCEQILTNKTNITMWLDLAFETENEPPYRPLNVEEDDCLRVTLRTQFKLSGQGRKVADLRAWWDQRTEEGVFVVPELGEHDLNQRGWFIRSTELGLTPRGFADAMTKAGHVVLSELSRRLSEAGFSLNIENSGTAA